MAEQKTPRHIHDEIMQKAFDKIAPAEWSALQILTDQAQVELDAAIDFEKTNNYALGHGVGYEEGYNHGYRDGFNDRLTKDQWALDPRSEVIELPMEEEE